MCFPETKAGGDVGCCAKLHRWLNPCDVRQSDRFFITSRVGIHCDKGDKLSILRGKYCY